MRHPCTAVLPALLTCLLAVPAAAQKSEGIDYFRQVRPILAQHCYECHGPDAKRRRAKLRLDRRQDALKDRDGASAVAPHRPQDSLLIERVTSKDPEEVMPPPKQKDPLSPEEIATLRQWMAQGAEWPDGHWAFTPPGKPPVPEREGTKTANPIDAFVQAKLAARGLAPARPAGKEELIRRVAFDLTGLPPTTAEVETFLADRRPGAYERLVDRLLASPRYGERQAQDWLDLARYADTNGYQADGRREAWNWREWVIKAFNANMPFDRFTVEQLAGDLLPDPTLQQLIATGFNRNHPTNSEAGSVTDEYRSAYVIDRVGTTATTWLGLTLACAQCHDHKFDPLLQKDFYRFYAFFNQVAERDNARFGRRNHKPSISVPNPDQAPHLADLKRRKAELKERLEAEDGRTDADQARWENRALEHVGKDFAWETPAPIGMLAHNGSILKLQEDGSILATGEAPVRDRYELAFKPGKKRIAAIRLEVLPGPGQPGGFSGRSRKGQFILSGIKVRVASLSDATDPPLVFIAKADADLNQKRAEEPEPDSIFPGSIAQSIVIDDKPSANGGIPLRFGGRGWSIVGDERKRRHEAILVPLETLKLNASSILRISLQQSSRPFKTLIARFRISTTSDERVRELMLPAVGKIWSAVGPFPARDAQGAWSTTFEPEKKLDEGVNLAQEFVQPKLESKTGKSRKKGPAAAKKSGPAGKKPGATPAGESGKPAGKPPSSPGKKQKTGKQGLKGKPGPDGKPSKRPAPKPGKGGFKGKPGAKGGSARKPGLARKPDAEKPASPAAGATKGRRRRPPPKLTWKAHREWRDGRSIRLSDGNVAWYLTRKIVSTRPRMLTLSFDGPAGVRAWLNGEVIYESKPAERAPTRARGRFSRRRASSPDRRVRIGIRKGESELVVKVVFGPARRQRRGRGASAVPAPPEAAAAALAARRRATGGTFTFTLEPEGEDVIDHEVVTALRTLADTQPPPEEAGDDEAPEQSREERLRKKIRRHYRTRHDTVGRLIKAQLDDLERELRTLRRKLPEAMVMEELKPKKRRVTNVFMRGEFQKKGARVEPGLPSAIGRLPKDLPRNRLGLAKWIVSKDNPLTARVTVNRVWQQHFGQGLVSTPEDFGIRGSIPTHPELLDWLALEFMENGWDLKQLHRLIVTSATYRQAAARGEESRSKDPDNRLLSRGPRQRLSAEMIRDNALLVAGLLVEKIGGKSIKPFQPAGLWKNVSSGQRYARDKGEDQYRRGLYVYWKRGVPYPSMVIFDAAKRETCTVKRARTTTPLQALVLLNDPVYVEAAKMLGQRMLKETAKDDAGRLRFGFRLCTGRTPGDEELEILASLLAKQRKHYASDEKAAKALLAVGDAKVSEKLESTELAAWTTVASTLLNLDATIHR